MSSLFPSNPIEETYTASGFLSTAETEPITLGNVFNVASEEAKLDSPVGALNRYIDYVYSTTEGMWTKSEVYQPQKANELYGQYGLNFSKPITKTEADYLAEQKFREHKQRELLSKNEGDFLSGAFSFAGAMFGAIQDPINIAASTIPITKLVPGLKALHATGSALDKMKVSFIDAAIGNAIVEPIPLAISAIDQRDYTAIDSLTNVFIGGLIGSSITGLGEGIKYISKGNKYNSLATGLKEYSNGEVPTAKQALIESSPTISKYSLEDLVELKDDFLDITQLESGKVKVQLNDKSLLGQLIGIGNDLTDAKLDLKQQYGKLLDNPILVKGYDFDTVAKKIETALWKKFPDIQSEDITKLLDTLKQQAGKQDIIDFIYKETNSLKDLDVYITALKVKPGKKVITTVKRIAKSLEDRIDERLAEVSVKRAGRKLLQQDQKVKSLREKLETAQKEESLLITIEGKQLKRKDLIKKRSKAVKALKTLAKKEQELTSEISLKQKQLDNTNKIARINKLTDEINDLKRALELSKSEINYNKSIIDVKPEQAIDNEILRARSLRNVLEQLDKEIRTTEDLRKMVGDKQKPTHQLDNPKAVEEATEYYNQIKDIPEKIETKELSKLTIDIKTQIFNIENTLRKAEDKPEMKQIPKEENIYSKIGQKLEQEVNEIEIEHNKNKKMKKDYEQFLECREGEL